MIPKIIHFIWIGNYIPAYVNYSINMFQHVNPNFTIHFVTKTIKELELLIDSHNILSIDDDLLYKCAIGILNNNISYINIINHCKKINLRFIQILTDIYRIELLNYYGGIYLDCDTFPIIPFDNKLLENIGFTVVRHFYNNYIINDNYFMGCQKNGMPYNIFDNTPNIKKILQTPKNWWKNINFLKNKRLFFKCELLYGEYSFSNNFYIDHYNSMSWKDIGMGIRTPICKYDYV